MRVFPPIIGASVLAFLLSSGCSIENGSPTSPSPPTTPTRITGTITNTMTGAVVGSFSSDASTLPTRVSVTWPGYLTRDAWVRSATPTVDLIQDAAPFSLAFYRQLVRNGFEAPSALQPVRVLTQAPSIYLQADGLTAANVAALEQVARETVPAMTGGRFSVASWESGSTVRAPVTGWIVAELVTDPNAACGRSQVGQPAGHIWLNLRSGCRTAAGIDPSLFRHELGHALGFWHVLQEGLLMSVTQADGPSAAPRIVSDLERYHATIAYHRPVGNTDVDVDPAGSGSLGTSQVSTDGTLGRVARRALHRSDGAGRARRMAREPSARVVVARRSGDQHRPSDLRRTRD